MFSGPVNKILYCYGIYQDTFDSVKREVESIEFLEGIPSQAEVKNFVDGMHNLMILDDLSDGPGHGKVVRTGSAPFESWHVLP